MVLSDSIIMAVGSYLSQIREGCLMEPTSNGFKEITHAKPWYP